MFTYLLPTTRLTKTLLDLLSSPKNTKTGILEQGGDKKELGAKEEDWSKLSSFALCASCNVFAYSSSFSRAKQFDLATLENNLLSKWKQVRGKAKKFDAQAVFVVSQEEGHRSRREGKEGGAQPDEDEEMLQLQS